MKILSLTLILFLSTAFSMPLFSSEAPQPSPEYEQKKLQKLGKFKKKYKNYCVNGKNPKKLSKIEYLQEFAKGPCSPAITIAGVSGTKLRLVIDDCEKLQMEDPITFKLCGWKSCSNKSRSSPKKEYQAWMPLTSSPFSFFSFNPKSNICFKRLLGFKITFEKDGKTPKFGSPPGIKIFPLGMSPETIPFDKSKCGAEALNSMVPYAGHYRSFLDMHQTLESFGYVFGLTAQSLPYDWRKDINREELRNRYVGILEDLYEATGKPVNIVAHSLGNYVTLNMLWNMPQKQKDRLISKYYSMASPFGGSPESNEYYFGSTDFYNYNFKIVDLGLNFKMVQETILKFPSVYQLTVKPIYEKNKDEPWMKRIAERIQEEKIGIANQKNDFLRVLPDFSEICQFGFSESERGCKLGLRDFWKIGEVEGKEVTPNTFTNLLEQYTFIPESPLVYESVRDPRFEEIKNPGVEVVAIFGNHLDSYSYFSFDNDPKEETLKGNFGFPNVTRTRGDGTVGATNSLLPAFKWMYDFETNTENSKPVRLIQFCGRYRRVSSVFQTLEGENTFNGIGCGCEPKKDNGKLVKGKDCNHPAMMDDVEMIEFLLESFIEKKTGMVGKKFTQMSENELETYQAQCKMLNRDN